ncbi:MAG TPA: lipopolysaccharide kinase InaA family protein [Syntrophorhabdaceae bacterium]|nr:lipopolysaccharide kinase InaA family protein [Syntrophorhabdaceae bacterium]HOL05252.1 lipopolysaccharide kinase InaA family protein [Syntrophorhabdaceae bacterium]HON84835.1 lipopolysaccharide kinase InaA family protein [Syntrophorhabdaceae bacterium]HOT41904.1 lipopolysaccharide kinase InaA family protein [Syntrophorhabdaceae bacterium]HPC66413.1 lipopolysaccharide kinase InaA family protein [Syntrophorhabdaceae bacterium]
MSGLKKTEIDRLTIFYYPGVTDLEGLIKEFKLAPLILKKGRGGIRIFNIQDKKIACRQYIHGGLFRFFTRDFFFSAKRVLNEINILSYLHSLNMPVAEPFCAIVERDFLVKKLYLLTIYEEETENLPEYLNKTDIRHRLRMAKKIALLFWNLEKSGIYHPDLHLDNILVKKKPHIYDSKGLKIEFQDTILIDFDKAKIKNITKKDMERMFWRLNRYIEKLNRKGMINVGIAEKTLFLRTYKRLSGYDMFDTMKAGLKYRRFFSRIGWWIDSFFYKSSYKR